ncbi:urease accessory protein UreD [Paenibacillus psychroresistens]|nr:urease accessory protein UreD [Paenibacillus psychroresistens]
MRWWLGSKTNFTMPEFTAELEATFAFEGGRTELQHKFHKSPLKIAKTFMRDDKQLGVCIMDCSPGMMAGDKYRLDWRLLPQSNVFITNQSYTKVHPSAEYPAYQLQSFYVDQGARLEYKPEPIMLYKEASFRADTEIKLEAGAVAFVTEVVCPGRVLRDEVFQYVRYDSQLQVYYENQLIYYNRQNIEPDSTKSDFRRLGSWENYTHQGTFYIFSDQLKSEYLKPIQELLERYPHLHAGASLTYKYGLIISVLGKSVWELQQLLDEAWLMMKLMVA